MADDQAPRLRGLLDGILGRTEELDVHAVWCDKHPPGKDLFPKLGLPVREHDNSIE